MHFGLGLGFGFTAWLPMPKAVSLSGAVPDCAAAADTAATWHQWTFTDEPGCVCLLSGDAVTQIGGVLDSMNDQSGAGHHFANTTRKPTYEASGGPNGEPDVRFPANTAIKATAPFAALTSADMFFLCKSDNLVTTGTTNSPWMFGSDVGAGNYWPFSDGKIYDGSGSTARKATGATPSDVRNWSLFEVISAPGEYTLKQGATQLFTTATNVVGWAATAVIGGNADPAAVSWVGNLALLVVYDHKLSAAARANLRALCQARYGVS